MREDVRAEDASTVMVLREVGGGLEVYWLQRHPKLRAWGGAIAFPGGKVDEDDFDPIFERIATSPLPRVAAFGDPPRMTRAVVVAAVRECFEEACLLPVLGDCEQARVEELRERWRSGEPLARILASERLVLDLGQLVPVARWATPKSQDVRFDARFFVMKVPCGQVGSHSEMESLEGCWSPPVKILERFERREVDLVPPTQWMLNMLRNYNRIDDVFAFAERQTLKALCPELSSHDSTPCLVLPGHPDHSLSVRCLEGPTSYDLIKGRFVLNLKS